MVKNILDNIMLAALCSDGGSRRVFKMEIFKMRKYQLILFCLSLLLYNCSNTALLNNKGTVQGKRPNRNVMQNVMANTSSLRCIYNERKVEKPELKGKIVVDFKITGTGELIDCQLVESTIKDSTFEQRAINEIKRWKFDAYIDKNDTTEKVLPFVFSP